MQPESAIKERLENIIKKIEQATAKASRPALSVKLIAVSKTFPLSAIKEALNCGQSIFGENYVQEAEEKHSALKDTNAELHFIGRLQSNKAKTASRIFSMVQSVHSLSLAKELSKHAQNLGKVLPILVQVNTSGENTKSGIYPEEAIALCRSVLSLPGVSLKGLMTIGSFVDEQSSYELRVKEFVLLRSLKIEAEKSLGVALPELSMGMSHDFELAIGEGATMVRVGSAIFGDRE